MRSFLIRAAIVALAVSSAPTAVPAQTQMQFPTVPWGGYAPAKLQCGRLLGANFNVTTDQAIPITVPTANWQIDSITVRNPSVSMTTAAGGFYTGAGKTGITVVANSQAYSGLTSNAFNTTGNFLAATLSTAGNTTDFGGFGQGSNRISTLYFALTTPQGAAATADIRVYCRPEY